MITMENKSNLSLLKQVPNIQRAREYRLYTEGGKRLVDLWLNGGSTILGHTQPNMLRELKNTASRGLYAPFPHFSEGRLLKALLKLFPGYDFRFYAAPPMELLQKKKETIDIKFWRPYVKPENPFDIDGLPSLFIPVLPGIQTWCDRLPAGLCIIAVQAEAAQADSLLLTRLPPSDFISPLLLTAAIRGIYGILAAPQRGKPNLPRINKVLKANTSKWQRQGIYLTLKKEAAREEWETLFHKFLEAGFLLPPIQEHPLILPAELSDGEEAKLAAALLLPN